MTTVVRSSEVDNELDVSETDVLDVTVDKLDSDV